MSNYSTLQENTLFGFSEAAGALYLALLDRYQQDERRAFFDACEFEDRVSRKLDRILRHMNPDQKTFTTLSKFFAERWRHNFMDSV